MNNSLLDQISPIREEAAADNESDKGQDPESVSIKEAGPGGDAINGDPLADQD